MVELIAAHQSSASAIAAPIRLPGVLLWRGYLLAFLASCATLVLELVAGRMLAPFIGASLYTWTSIIGIVLAGVSLGSWLGGKLADRRPSRTLLGGIFFASGASCLLALGLVQVLGEWTLIRLLPLMARIFVLTTLVFLPPSLLLGMVTPVVIRLTLADVKRTGRVVGLICAFGTAGSLVGNFLTGFLLTAYFPVTQIVIGVSLVLLVLGAWELLGRKSHREHQQPAAATAELDGVAVQPRESALLRARDPLDLTGNVVLASFVVVIASFCTMGIELSASRLLAPTLGLSLYSWTGIIGAVLAGIALGNYVGGRIADRWPDQRVLGLSLFAGGLASFSILILASLLNVVDLFGGIGLMGRIVLLTSAIFFVPVVLLGTISPQVIRLAVTDLRRAGRTAGQIYAWSTAGAIVGTFATGWWLISTLGVRALIFAMGAILLALALIVGRFWRQPLALTLLSLTAVGSGLVLSSRDALTSTCTRETNYFCIKVYEDNHEGFRVKSLVLDHLIHSYVKLDDPTYLGYAHEYVQAEITRYTLVATGAPHVLVIGGGGYTYPRWVEAALPEATVEVVEIDPGVTDVAYDHLGLSRQSEIVSYNLDGRQFVNEMAPRGYYGVVVQDAVNDLSVPYHIMTKEYNEQVKATLAPGGAYLLTVIDHYQGGQLLRAASRTMMQTFPQVQLLSAGRSWDAPGASVWVIAGSEQGIDLDQMRPFLAARTDERMRSVMLEPERLQAYLDDGPQIVLTDQYAPVDNLIAPLFTRRG